MSKSNPKKVVDTSTLKAKAEPPSVRKSSGSFSSKDSLIFTKENFKWTGIALVLIFVGLWLMVGGSMPNPETWDPNIIYSARRTVLAPIFILSGLGVQVYAIFK